MGILQRIRDRFSNLDESRLADGRNLSVRAIPTYVPTWQEGKPQWLPERPETYIGDGYSKVVVAYRCVNLLANSVAAAVMRTYDVDQSGQRVPIDPDAPGPNRFGSSAQLATIVRDPNPWMSQAELLAIWTKIAAVSGFGLLEKVRAEKLGQPLGLWPLRSDWLKPIPREGRQYDWEWTVPGRRPQEIAAEDVIVFTFEPSPTLSPIGVPPLQAALREVGIENEMTDYAKMLFQNNGIPSYIATVDPNYILAHGDLDQDDIDLMRAKMHQRFGGSRGAGEMAVLPWLKDIQRLALDFDEMAYPELRDLTSTQICSAFGVPPILVGIKAGIDASTYSNYEQARRAFFEDTVFPLWGRIDGALTRGLVPEYAVPPSVSLEFDTSDVPALQDDVTPTWDRVDKAWNSGWAMLDEVRAEVGLDALGPGIGDQFRWQLVPAPSFGLPAADAARMAPITVKVREIAPRALQSAQRAFVQLPPETRSRVADTARQEYERLAKKGAPALRRFWREQGQRVASAATRTAKSSILHRNAEGIPRVVGFGDAVTYTESRDIAAIDWADEDDLLAEVLERLHVSAGKAAFDVVGDLLSSDSVVWSIDNPHIQDVLSELGQRVGGINETTRERLQGVVGDALDEGVTMDELADRIATLFGEGFEGRAMVVARTESQMAYNLGAREAYRASGQVSRVELMDNPEHTEDYGASDGLSCAERNGIIVTLDQMATHVEAEHPNGTLAVLPLLDSVGEE